MRGADIAVAPQAGRGKIDGKQPPVHRHEFLSAEEEEAEAAASKEPVGHAVHRHEFLLRGLAERCGNLEFEVGENGRFSDRARILLAQGVSIERRLKVVEEGLIELQLYQLERIHRDKFMLESGRIRRGSVESV